MSLILMISSMATTSNMQMHNFSIIQQISSSVSNWHFWKLGTRIWQIEILLILLNTRSTLLESLMCEFDNEKVIRSFMISSSSQQKFQVYTKFSFAFHEIKKNALPSLLPSQVQNLIFQRCEEELSDAKQILQNCSINSCIQDSCIFMHWTWLAAMLFIIKISSIFHYSENHKFILHSSSKGFCSKL